MLSPLSIFIPDAHFQFAHKKTRVNRLTMRKAAAETLQIKHDVHKEQDVNAINAMFPLTEDMKTSDIYHPMSYSYSFLQMNT